MAKNWLQTKLLTSQSCSIGRAEEAGFSSLSAYSGDFMRCFDELKKIVEKTLFSNLLPWQPVFARAGSIDFDCCIAIPQPITKSDKNLGKCGKMRDRDAIALLLPNRFATGQYSPDRLDRMSLAKEVRQQRQLLPASASRPRPARNAECSQFRVG